MKSNIETLNWSVGREVCERLKIAKWKPVVASIQVELDSKPERYSTIEKKLDAAFEIAFPYANSSALALDEDSPDSDEDDPLERAIDKFVNAFPVFV